MTKTPNISLSLMVILLIIFASAPLISATFYQAPSDANLEILPAKISPQPARPGEDMFVKINVENYGQDPAEDVVIELEENYPFHFKYSNAEHAISKHYTNTTITIPKISAFGSYEAFYYFTVDPMAKTGEYDLSFKILRTKKGGTVGTIRYIKIFIEGTPDLILTDSSMSLINISPGDDFTLKTTVKSVGTGNAKNIRVSLVLDDLPKIIPLEGSNRFIPELDAGESRFVSFNLKLSKDAEPTSYSIPLKLTGIDETGNRSSTHTDAIGFDVHAKAKLSIANIKTEPVIGKANEEMTLTIRIENVGEGDAKSVKATITDIPFPGVKQAFLGKIEADDDSSAVFNLIPDKSGEMAYTFQMSYEDDFGEHNVSEELDLVIESNNNSLKTIVYISTIFVLAVLGGYYYFKQKKET